MKKSLLPLAILLLAAILTGCSGSDSYGCAEVYARLLRRAGDLSAFEKVYSFN